MGRFDYQEYIEKNFDYEPGGTDHLAIDCLDEECEDFTECGKHLYINYKNGKGYCYKCNQAFSKVRVVRLHEKCSFAKAQKIVLGLDIDFEPIPIYARGGENALDLALASINEPEKVEKPEEALKVGAIHMPPALPWNFPRSGAARKYLEKRRFDATVIDHYDIFDRLPAESWRTFREQRPGYF